jgi:hypothetical protein
LQKTHSKIDPEKIRKNVDFSTNIGVGNVPCHIVTLKYCHNHDSHQISDIFATENYFSTIGGVVLAAKSFDVTF